DLVGDIRAQNQPGTTRDVYPNWCMPLCDSAGLPVLIEQLAHNALFRTIAATSKRPSYKMSPHSAARMPSETIAGKVIFTQERGRARLRLTTGTGGAGSGTADSLLTSSS